MMHRILAAARPGMRRFGGSRTLWVVVWGRALLIAADFGRAVAAPPFVLAWIVGRATIAGSGIRMEKPGRPARLGVDADRRNPRRVYGHVKRRATGHT